MKKIIIILFCLVTTAGWAQTEETAYAREKSNWSVGGLIILPYVGTTEGFDNNTEQYIPQISEIWLGHSFLNMGENQAQLNLKNGALYKLDLGCTLLQVSRNLYHGIAGVSVGIQVEAFNYTVANGYGAYKSDRLIIVEPKRERDDKDYFDFTMLRVPMLIGVQTRNQHFSVQTGFALCYSSQPGAQWLATVGIGPATINYSKNLSPLFKTSTGARAFPSSLTIGVDILYCLCHFSK